MTQSFWFKALTGLFTAGFLVACGDSQAPQTPAATATTTPPALLRKPAPAGSQVYFIAPQEGDEVSNPVSVQFGLKNMGVAPAGVDQPNTGHHHLLVDAELQRLDLPIPADARHLHFGGGQTQTSLTLTPGTHTLQLVLGDFLHIPHDPPVTSSRITITVIE